MEGWTWHEKRRREEGGEENHIRIRQGTGRVGKEDGMSGKEERRAGCEMRKRVGEGIGHGSGRRGEDDIDRLKKMSQK